MKTTHLDRYGLAYIIAVCLTLGAALNSFAEIFGTLTREAWAMMGWWQILALFAKSLNAAPMALLAYLIKSPLASAADQPAQVLTATLETRTAPALPPVAATSGSSAPGS